MESPELDVITTPHTSKKRVLSMSSSSIMEDEVLEIPPPPVFSNSKKAWKPKEVMFHEIIDVDEYEGSDDIIMLDGKDTVHNNKGKTPALNLHPGDAAADAYPSLNTAPTKPGSISFITEEQYADLDVWYDDEVAMVQAHFDSLDTPTGVEASVPWWPFPAESKEQVASATHSLHSSLQSLDESGSGKSNQFQNMILNQPVQTTISSPKSAYSYGNPTSSVPSSHIGLQLNYNGKISSFGTNPHNSLSSWPEALVYGQHLSSATSSALQGAGTAWTNSNFASAVMSNSSSHYILQPSEAQFGQISMNGPSPSFFGVPGMSRGKVNSPASFNPSISYNNDISGFPCPGKLKSSSSYNPFIKYDNSISGEVSDPVDFVFGRKEELNEVDMLKKFDLFKRFDVVEDHSDHHYRAKGSKQPSKSLAKKIQEEWKILENDLPDTIFVRAYETRMDLLRAVIMGAEGTPYHDGIFFFDVYFPSDYPNTPPLVYYHSGGLRLNPNLYNNGKVCLSLLNTWSGSSDEKWRPGYSTILQVLVSIQGLVLNSKPYFNEPGFSNSEGTQSGDLQSKQYNENTFLLSLKTMLYTLRRTPKHFEDLVYGHFCKHARKILEACNAYKNGAEVGTTVGGGTVKAEGTSSYCSQTLQMILPSFVKPLIEAFTKLGVKDCDGYFPLDTKKL
ncbi:Belongs to the ubiquitin-conjugating enzyme [Dionaea muscipula]